MDDDIYDAPDYDSMEESFHYGGHVQSEYYNSRYKWKQWITGELLVTRNGLNRTVYQEYK